MQHRYLLSSLLILTLLPTLGLTKQPDFAALRQTVLELGKLTEPPKVHPSPTTDNATIRSLFFEALPFKDKPTRVYARINLPEAASIENKVPGIVLVHGGGGSAFSEWVKLWNKQGYAAISIAVEGQTDQRDDKKKWQKHEWSGPSRSGIYGDSDAALKDQWMYHAVADTVLANSLLRSIPEVDDNKIGIMGISWGGVITSTVIGIDSRFAFAIPTYGCGDLSDAPNQYGRALGKNDMYKKVWDPVLRLGNATMPTLWLSWTGDSHFPMPNLRSSYQAMQGPYQVALIPKMKHGHGAGWRPTDSYTFADSVLKGGQPWCQQTSVKTEANKATVTFKTKRKIDSAVLTWTADAKGPTATRKWQDSKAEVSKGDGDKLTVEVELPESAAAWFINLKSGKVYASSDFQD